LIKLNEFDVAIEILDIYCQKFGLILHDDLELVQIKHYIMEKTDKYEKHLQFLSIASKKFPDFYEFNIAQGKY
jgi:hypothetical protein